jgi:hypothetical protein
MSTATLSLAMQRQLGTGPNINATGPWDITTTYAPDDSATAGGLTYICTVGVLGGTGPALDTSHWAVAGSTDAASILALSNSLLTDSKVLAKSRYDRRVGLLNDSMASPNAASDYPEVQAGNTQSATAAIIADRVVLLKATDSQGPLAATVANLNAAWYVNRGNALTAAADTLNTLQNEVLT